MDDSSALRFIVAAIGTAATYLWGGWDAILIALFVFACMDFVTGYLASAVAGETRSDKGFIGLARKIGMFLLVGLANVIDHLGGFPEPMLRTAVIWGYIIIETTSIIENVGEIGVPVPRVLRRMLAVLREREGGK